MNKRGLIPAILLIHIPDWSNTESYLHQGTPLNPVLLAACQGKGHYEVAVTHTLI